MKCNVITVIIQMFSVLIAQKFCIINLKIKCNVITVIIQLFSFHKLQYHGTSMLLRASVGALTHRMWYHSQHMVHSTIGVWP